MRFLRKPLQPPPPPSAVCCFCGVGRYTVREPIMGSLCCDNCGRSIVDTPGSLPSFDNAGSISQRPVLRVAAADRVPGLWNATLAGAGGDEYFYDLTVGQVDAIAGERDARIERVG